MGRDMEREWRKRSREMDRGILRKMEKDRWI